MADEGSHTAARMTRQVIWNPWGGGQGGVVPRNSPDLYKDLIFFKDLFTKRAQHFLGVKPIIYSKFVLGHHPSDQNLSLSDLPLKDNHISQR